MDGVAMSQQIGERVAARDNPARKLTTVIMRLPSSMVVQIDQFGGDRFLHRSERIRGLLDTALKAEIEGSSHG
jgi:hypothetical protein